MQSRTLSFSVPFVVKISINYFSDDPVKVPDKIQSISFFIDPDFYKKMLGILENRKADQHAFLSPENRRDLDFFNMLVKNLNYCGSTDVCLLYSLQTSQKGHPRRILRILKSVLEYFEKDAQEDFIQAKPMLECIKNHYAKQVRAKPIAPFSKRKEHFLPITGAYQTTHNPSFIAEIKNSNGEKIRFLVKGKEGGKGSAIAEWEALFSEYYRLLLGVDRHPKVFLLHNSDHEHVGIASSFTAFETLHNRYMRFQKKYTLDEMLDAGLGYTIAAIFLGEEADPHFDNLAFDVNGKLIKFDDDRSGWSRLCHYFGYRYKNQFDITEAALRSLPFVQNDSEPGFQWISRFILLYCGFTLSDLQRDPRFFQQIFHVFLKKAIIPEEVFRGLADGIMGSPKRKKEAYDLFVNKQRTLLDVLKGMDNFQIFLAKHADSISIISDEFQDYNNSVVEYHPECLVELNQVDDAFNELYREPANYFLEEIKSIPDEEFKKHFECYEKTLDDIDLFYNYMLDDDVDDEHRCNEEAFQACKKRRDELEQQNNVLLDVRDLFLSIEAKTKKLGGLKKIVEEADGLDIVFCIEQKIIDYCAHYVKRQSASTALKNRSIFSPAHAEDEWDVLFSALAEWRRNFKFDPAIHSLTDLIRTQQKRAAIIKIGSSCIKLQKENSERLSSALEKDHSIEEKNSPAEMYLNDLITEMKSEKFKTKEVKYIVSQIGFHAKNHEKATVDALVGELSSVESSKAIVRKLKTG